MFLLSFENAQQVRRTAPYCAGISQYLLTPRAKICEIFPDNSRQIMFALLRNDDFSTKLQKHVITLYMQWFCFVFAKQCEAVAPGSIPVRAANAKCIPGKNKRAWLIGSRPARPPNPPPAAGPMATALFELRDAEKRGMVCLTIAEINKVNSGRRRTVWRRWRADWFPAGLPMIKKWS
jgi:hypothetical protein